MNPPRLFTITGCLAIACVLLSVGQSTAAPTEQEIARAIRDLGDSRYRTREEASAVLWKAGKAAEPALELALRSNDAEVVKRVRSILERFRWGIYPDTPPEVVALIEQYRSGDARLREQSIEGLLRRGLTGYEAMLKIATAERDKGAREWFWNRVSQELPRVLPTTILDGNLALAEQLLELSAQEENEQSIRNFAACLLLRGRLEPKIKEYRERVERGFDRQSATILAYLYRANGDLVKARWAAEQTQENFLLDSILHELGDWKTLASRAERGAQPGAPFPATDMESLGFRAAYHRLAGNPAEFEKALADLRRAAANTSLDDGDRWFGVEALLVNGRPDEAIAHLGKGKNVMRAFELLVAQARYREAFALADKADRSVALDVARAQTLHLLGEKDKALAELTRLAEPLAKLANSRDAMTYEVLLEAEGKLGLRELQRQHAGLILKLPEKENNLGWVFHQLYSGRAEASRRWWDFFRAKHPQEEPIQLLERLDKVEGPNRQLSELTALAPLFEATYAQKKPDEREMALRILGDGFTLAGEPARGIEYLKRAAATYATPSLLLALADVHVDQKEWQLAAERYQQAWEKDRTQAGPLYLQGWALEKAGKSDEGKKLMELAELLPLANDDSRYLLGEAIRKRGLAEPARRQRELFIRLGEFASWYIDEAQRLEANVALNRKDYLKAAEGYERFLISCLRPSTSMVEVESYLLVPRFIHQHRARAHLAAGQPEAAMKEARLALAAMPGAMDVAIELTPELDHLGRRQDADELFNAVFKLEEDTCTAFPRSAHHHNAAAWLGATCRRELDRAFEHGRQAVRLGPDNPAYLDTLAELQFQRGQQEQALTLMKKCLELAPKRRYYQEQLKRIQAGDPKVPVPDENAPD